MASGPPCDAAWKASAVFLGKVDDLRREERTNNLVGRVPPGELLPTRVTFEVTEPYIGMEGRTSRIEVRTGMGGGDCGYPFQIGRSYVVYASGNETGFLVANSCSRTAPAERAAADLAYLRSLPQGVPSTFIYGVVGNGESATRYDSALRMETPDGIPDAAVTLMGPGTNKTITAKKDGSFRFEPLAPGTYRVSVSKKGYRLRFGPGPLEVHASGCAYAWESLVVDRRIVGTVHAADGTLVAGVQVELLPFRPTEQNQLPFPVTEGKTDREGRYELKDIRPGQYYLGINLARTPSADMPYAQAFYPGTQDPAHAGLVNVGEEAEIKTCDFPFPAPQKRITVEGFVHWPDGRPAENTGILLEDIRWPWATNMISAATDARGRFEISAFDATRYRIHAVTMARLTNEAVSAEPLSLHLDGRLQQPIQLVLTRKGHSAAELVGKGLERWRAGLGL